MFFENISVGDNLEKCIAKGLVESTGGPHAGTPFEWELTDSNIKIYFQRTGAVFDNNNIIKEIELLASDYTNKNNRKSVDVKKSFNYMLQYFSQRYTGMKQRDFKTEGVSSCLYDVGKEYYWETSNLLIKVHFIVTSTMRKLMPNKTEHLEIFVWMNGCVLGNLQKLKSS